MAEFRSKPLRAFGHFSARRNIAAVGLLLLAAVFLLRAGQLTIGQHSYWVTQAQQNLEGHRRLEAPRGRIFDRNGDLLAGNRRTYEVTFATDGLPRAAIAQTVSRLRDLSLPVLDQDGIQNLDAATVSNKQISIRLARRAAQSDLLPLLENPQELPAVRVAPDFRREYPQSTSLALVVGFTGPMPEGARAAYSAERYNPDDWVGRSGLEARYENVLAGVPGLERLRRDVAGRPAVPDGIITPARPGADLVLTIDARWQRFAHESLQGLKGSVVLMDPWTGEIAILASFPAFDPANPGAELADGAPASYLQRATRAAYPPGSTMKPFTALAALRAGLSPADHINCTGKTEIVGWLRPFHCNVRTGHGPMNVRQSLQASCNVFYYEAAKRIGIEPMLDELSRFGFGAPTGVDLAGEVSGQVRGEGKLDDGEVLNLSIGQGQSLATTLQVARAYAALANLSYLPTPHLVRQVVLHDGTVEPSDASNRRTPVDLPRHLVGPILDGLSDVVNVRGGTAFKAGIPTAWEVSGKTGTAENARGGNDAWFAGFYPRSNPRWVIVVHVEDAEGHGGDVAAPIARGVIATTIGGAAEVAHTAARDASGASDRARNESPEFVQ